jgi:hypothetical protein
MPIDISGRQRQQNVRRMKRGEHRQREQLGAGSGAAAPQRH